MMEKAFGTADDALAELQLEYSHSNKQRKPKKTAAEAWQSLEEDFVSKKPRKPREVHCTDGERKTYPLQKSRKTKPSNYKAANTSQYPECSSDPIIECSNADIELDDLCMEQTCNQRETSYDHSDKLWTNIREEIFIIFKHVYYHVEEKHLKVAETYTQDDGCDCDAVSSINNVKIYTDSGVIISRYAFKSSCKCPSRYNNMVREGLWPLSLGGQPSFVTFGLIDMCSQLLSACPSLSYAALSQALSNICMRKTLNSDNKVRAELISCSMREFRNMEFRAEGEVFDPFSCPSCLNNPHAIHLDGNMKLYRYKSAGQRSSIEARSKGLFDPDDAVNKLVETVRSDKNNKTAKTCGASQWKAAKANAPAPSALIDETGIELATCRHVFIQKAINMTRGEIYAYPYYMQLQFPGAEYICLDTACRYWPWLRRLDPELAVKQKPLLSVMHSKAHQFKCQVTWNGRWTDGAGLSTGETTEQANSYVSRLGITTKHMLKAVREERLTEGAAYWNRQKLLNLPRELLKCSKRTLQRRATSQLQLAELENNHQLGQSQIVDFITYLQTGYQDTQNTELEAKISAESCLRQTTIARMTSCKSTKQRYRLQKKLVKCNNSLERLVEEYVEEHGDITTDELLNMAKRNEQASLPWITASQFGGQFDILLKAAELYQYIRRCTEELNILQSEIKNIYSTVERHIESAAPDSRKMTVFRVLRSQLSEAFIGSGFEPSLNTPSDDDSDSETEDDWLSDDE